MKLSITLWYLICVVCCLGPTLHTHAMRSACAYMYMPYHIEQLSAELSEGGDYLQYIFFL